MSTKPALQKILKGILHSEERNKSIHKAAGKNKPCWNNTKQEGNTEITKHYKINKMSRLYTELSKNL